LVSTATWKLPSSRRREPPHFSKSQVVNVLEQVGTLLLLDGANVFRVRAYENASRILASEERNLLDLASGGTIFDVKGIGKGIGGLITEAVMEGSWGDLPDLYERTPDGLISMLAIPGLGPKRIKQFHDELGIDTVQSLREAAEAGALAPLLGMGAKSEQRIIDGIELLARVAGRRRLDVGLLYGESLESRIAAMDGVERASLSGSARRRRETIGDLDIVAAVAPANVDAVIERIVGLPGIADVKGSGESKVSVILGIEFFEGERDVKSPVDGLDSGVLAALGGEAWEEMSESTTIDAQVRLVPPRSFPYTLAYFTGSKEHNVRLRQRALDRGLRLSEWGLSPIDKIGESTGIEAAEHSLPAEDEGDIYRHLELDWVPPELREDTGEVEAAESAALPRLVEPNDIRGALHNHTIASDGTATLEEMASAALALGWEFLGIADHSEILNIGGRSIGVAANDVAEQGRRIDSLNDSWRDDGVDFRLLHGAECDILTDGSLDYDDDIRASLSHVVGSVHAIGSWRGRDEIENTEAMIRAIEDPTFTVLGHPTGRILGGRDGFPIDMHGVLRRMGELNEEGALKAVEINASPYRLDLDWRYCRFAKEQGVPIVINPDAHSPRGLRDVWFGVQMARKGWIEADDLLNCKSGEDIEEMLGGSY